MGETYVFHTRFWVFSEGKAEHQKRLDEWIFMHWKSTEWAILF